jgi:hypothetical protein
MVFTGRNSRYYYVVAVANRPKLSGLSTDLCSTPVFTDNNFNVTALGSTVNIYVDQVQTTLTSTVTTQELK